MSLRPRKPLMGKRKLIDLYKIESSNEFHNIPTRMTEKQKQEILNQPEKNPQLQISLLCPMGLQLGEI